MSDDVYLPRAGEAIVPLDKLVAYALNPEHSRGQHKARVFRSALGIDRSDWRYLQDQLVEGVAGVPVRGTRMTPFGVLYEIVLSIDGLNGATHPVMTIWLAEPDAPPRLVSTWWTSRDGLRHFLVMHARHEELEVVELLTEVGRWPAGTAGTVVKADESTALVEISDDRGHGLDFISVPQDALAAAGEATATAQPGPARGS